MAVIGALRNRRSIAHHKNHIEILIEFNVILSTLALRVIDLVQQGAVLILFLDQLMGTTSQLRSVAESLIL